MKKQNLKNIIRSGLLLSAIFPAQIIFAQATDTLQSMNEVVVLGSRSQPRVQTESPVPVDVIDMKKISGDAPQISMNAILNYTVPSFTSTPQTVADGTDHIDPASLRGLGPDQTLVLLNGKRRHTTSLVNVNGTMGRGAVGTDLSAIPSMAIEKLEVLRDGAAAQYGSDAIAGVINLGLRKNTKGTQVRITGGANVSTFQAYTEAGKGDYSVDKNPEYVKRNVVDGVASQIGVNHGMSLGSKGFLNLTGTVDVRDYTTRAGERTGAINNKTVTGLNDDAAYFASAKTTRDDYRMRVGQSTLLGGQAFANAGYTLNEINKTELYAFGGYSYRQGSSAGFYRLPFNNRNIVSQYPNGFLPLINSTIQDLSFAAGIRGEANGWHYDVSNTIGRNSFDFDITNTLNASTTNPDNYKNGPVEGLDSTKKSFNAGGLRFLQNTSNIDFSKNMDVLAGLNVAFGAEVRAENYQQVAGETASWANYNTRNAAAPKSTDLVDINGTIQVSSLLANGAQGVPQAGAQVFPGFRPNTAFSEWRNSRALYLDLEQNFTKDFLINLAGRVENYSDFGTNFSWKAASRLKTTEWLTLRGSVSTGFRAPSLHQRYTFKTSSVTVAGVPTEQGTLRNDSKAAELLGIPKLKAETSISASVGFTINKGPLKLTVDAYQTNVYDRIIYTDAFSGTSGNAITGQIASLLLQAQAGSALFFANAIDTRNRGIDAVLSYNLRLPSSHNIRFDISGTLSQVELVGEPKTSDILKPLTHVYLSPINKNLLLEAFPRQKANLIVNYSHKNLSVFLRESFFGQTTHLEGTYTVGTGNPSRATDSYFFEQTISPLFLTDLSVSYNVSKQIKVTLGANNVFDIYPDIVSASKGKFFKLETDASKTTYNTIIDTKSAKELGIKNDDDLTTNNQFVYSRRTSNIGLNGRFLFARLEFNF